ncbi:hypothetical protein DSO57_1013110 [Entomophthora muscae]|uniref:Uncharacterized protein n=1 Tax=Entomophthora muscae TaxID=34485 RepID=A0ACC2U4W7_9FUNG|nr:hypothetical protein DSO57_1013110 [Entomophthora muscae]
MLELTWVIQGWGRLLYVDSLVVKQAQANSIVVDQLVGSLLRTFNAITVIAPPGHNGLWALLNSEPTHLGVSLWGFINLKFSPVNLAGKTCDMAR